MIRLQRLRKNHPGTSTPILHDVTAEFPEGQVSIILGEPGCGKSSLLHCILQLVQPDAGLMMMNGKRLQAGRWEPSIAAVLQSPTLFQHMSVMENVLLGPKLVQRHTPEMEKEAYAWFEYLDLLDCLQALPHRLTTAERYRVSIVRALLMDPAVLLLDSPTDHLADGSSPSLVGLIQKLAAQNRTLVITTPDWDFAQQVGERIYLMRNGSLFLMQAKTAEGLGDLPKAV